MRAGKATERRKDPMLRSGLEVRLTNGRSLPIKYLARVEYDSNSSSAESSDRVKERETQFARLPSGTLVDLVRDSSGELTFAVFQDGITSLQAKVQHGDVTLIPPPAGSGLARPIRFATTVTQRDLGARKLLDEIEDVINRYCECDPSDQKLLAHFALYSWVSDLARIAPYIWVVGPYGYGKTNLLQILSAICRRSILVSDISMAGLYRILTIYHPTLILDEFEPGKDSAARHIQRLLRAGSTMGQSVLRASGVYDLFGPKVIASRYGIEDSALESRGFFVVARPLSREISVLTPDGLDSIAEQLQPKLLAFRLNNYGRLKSVNPSFTLNGSLNPRMQDMARALSLPLTGDADLQSQLLTLVEGYGKVAVQRDSDPEWYVALTLLNLAHTLGPGAPVRWTAKMISKNVRSSAESRGESFNPTPRKVGRILHMLGLNTKRLGSPGRGLESSPKLKDRIHEIAKGLGVCAGDLLNPEFPDAPLSCARCEKYNLSFDNKGTKLRYEPFSMGPEDPDNPTWTP